MKATIKAQHDDRVEIGNNRFGSVYVCTLRPSGMIHGTYCTPLQARRLAAALLRAADAAEKGTK